MERLVSFRRAGQTGAGGQVGLASCSGIAGRHLRFADVLVVGCILNTFIRRSDVVKIGCLAQLVNVIAPIMTVEDGPAWRQTTFYPYLFASKYGRGTALDLAVDVDGYESDYAKNVPYLDISGVLTEADGGLSFFLVNRHETEALDVDLSLEGFAHQSIAMDKVLGGHALDKVNGPEAEAVVPADGEGASIADGKLSVTMAPLSYRMIRLK